VWAQAQGTRPHGERLRAQGSRASREVATVPLAPRPRGEKAGESNCLVLGWLGEGCCSPGRGSGRIASPEQRGRPPTSAAAGEGPRAPNAVPVLEALSPLTRRAARAGLSALRALRDPHALPLPPRLRRALARCAPLRGARQYGRWRGRWEGSMESAEQAWTPSPAPLRPGRKSAASSARLERAAVGATCGRPHGYLIVRAAMPGHLGRGPARSGSRAFREWPG
jgi:hypothetical protein